MIGEYTEKMKIVGDNLKNKEFVTTEGEVVKISKRDIELLALDVVNYSEILAGVDKETLANEKSKEILGKIKDQDTFQIFIKENCGSFYFNFYKRLVDKIEPQYLTRFLYLCTYLDYEGRLVQKRGNMNVSVKENELQFILRLSVRETFNTKKELIDKELIHIKDEIIYINNKYCKKGDIMKNGKVEKVRMFNCGIKDIYEMSTKTEHKKLALLFQLLPYINLRWNVICKNPEEELLENIKPYNIKELMELLNQTNVTRFKSSLLNLTVCNEAVVAINSNKYGELLTINPKVYYKGVDVDELNYLVGLFSLNREQ